MSKVKFKASIFFPDSDGEKRFLFKIINYGQETDELKFIFDHPKYENALIFNQEGKKYPDESIFRKYGELSYHSDGSLLWKLPETEEGHDKLVDNPHGTGSRRTALSALEEWEPVVHGNIIRYKTCYTSLTEDAQILPDKPEIFNGDPFEYYIFLGHMKYQKPPNSGSDELVYRINDVGKYIDMVLWVRKSQFYGEPFEFGGKTVINDNNRVGIAEPRLQVDERGAVELDLKILWNASWNTKVVDDNKDLNVNALKRLPPLSKISKAYLNDNPFLNQLIDLIGFNKGFAVSPFFKDKKLGIELTGILDKDEDGAFFGLGTNPPE